MSSQTVQIDKAGRVVLPKILREHFNLLPGDKLRLIVDKNSIRLEPTDPAVTLVRKGGVLVFRGEFSHPITSKSVEEIIGRDRKERTAHE